MPQSFLAFKLSIYVINLRITLIYLPLTAYIFIQLSDNYINFNNLHFKKR